MERTTQPTACQHQLVFLPSLDDAASCARCGAIVLIAPQTANEHGVTLEWLPAGADGLNGERMATQNDD